MFLGFDAIKLSGSAFLEIQYCKLPEGKSIKDIVSVDSIKHWDNKSLYVYDNDINEFYNEYAEILQNGVYNNLCEGKLDICGINYYNICKAQAIIERVESIKPIEYEIFLEWLNDGLSQNGFYILGL